MWIPVKSWSQVEQQLNADDAQFPVSSTDCLLHVRCADQFVSLL